ncbi:MAG: ankyrin repeat domain-containing protein [Povalibacter sp.]
MSCFCSASFAAKPAAALIHAVRSGDVMKARTLLRPSDANTPLPDGSTLLAWAVESQGPDMVRLLLDRGAKPNAPQTLSPLLVACQNGDAAIVNMLLDAHADVNAPDRDGITPVSVCAGSASNEIMKRMIAAGADVEHADSNGQTPIMWAAAKGRVENVQLLMENGASINRATQHGFTPLFFAIKSGNPNVPIAVMNAGGSPDYIAPDGTSAVQLAIYQKAYDFAARLIERGANLTIFDRNGRQLLHAAIDANQPSLVELLLAKGADVNASSGPSRVKMRFEVNFKSGDYEAPRSTPLLLAAEKGEANIMQLLLNAGADKEHRREDGTNVVLAAATSGKLAALELALRIQPDVNATNTRGQTPLRVMLGSNASSETIAMMQLLAAKGARTDIQDRAGTTPADAAKEAETEMKTAFEATFLNRTASNP